MINSTRINTTTSDANAYLKYNTDNQTSYILYENNYDVVPNRNFSGFASGCTNLVADVFDIRTHFLLWDEIRNFSSAFNGCSNLLGNPNLPLNTYDASYAYAGCNNLQGSPVIVESTHEFFGLNMCHIYDGCSKLSGSPVMPNNRIPSNMSYAFAECTNLRGNPVCPNTNEIYASYNFQGTYLNCRNLTGPVMIPTRAENIENAYRGCTNVTGSPETGNSNLCNNMAFAYYGCSNITGEFVMPINIINAVSAYDGCVNMESSTITLTTPEYGNGLVNMANCFKNKNNDVYINLRVHGSNVWNSWLFTYGNSGENSVVGYDFNWVSDVSSQRFYNMEAGILVYYNLNFPPKPVPVGNVGLAYFNLESVQSTLTQVMVTNMEG